MRALVTGGAGFIGSHFVDRLLDEGYDTVAYDNFSTGQERFLERSARHPRFRLVRGDLMDRDALATAAAGADIVFHMAANADVRFGTDRPERDVHQNALATFYVLEAMRATGVTRIVFSSTGSVYGEPTVFPTPENAPFPLQTSLYGAAKLASEGLIQAYCEGFGFRGHIFRFVSILGERYSHGHIFDFYKQLREHPGELRRPRRWRPAEVVSLHLQTSLYGAAKLASEGLIQAYCEGFGFRGHIFRFVSILGERYSHGHIFDFYKQRVSIPESSTSSAMAASGSRISTFMIALTR